VFGGESESAIDSPETLPPLVVAVVNWNGRRVLRDCLGSLLDSSYRPLRVLMVDNASSDDSVDFVARSFPAVEIIQSEHNLRWAGGNNLVIRRLIAEGPGDGYLLLLNNDTIVPQGSLERLVLALADEPRAWAATPRICYAHDPAQVWYDGGRVGRFTGWIQHHGIRQLAGKRSMAYRFVGYGSGCALLLGPKALRLVGEIDESFYFYGEDTDYSLRIRERGGRILHVPKALVLHMVSSALGSRSPLKVYLRSRSHIKLLRRHWSGSQVPLVLAGQLLYYGGLAAWHLWGGRWRTAQAALLGVIDELRGAAQGTSQFRQ